MKTILGTFLALGTIGLSLAGCSSDPAVVTPVTDGGVVTDTGVVADSGTTPAAPTLGVQIDRFGRPAVNTALNHAFDANAATAGSAKDAYNADKNAATWSATYKKEVASNLAILDSLDTVCGNQLGAGAAGAGRYDGLAGVLADDRVWVNTAGTTCNQYLAVELDALNVAKNTDCGGRTLKYDVIDVTYSAVAIGATSGVGDGITADATKTGGTSFPYLAAAQ